MLNNPKGEAMKKVWDRVRGHFEQYVSRYSVAALAVLTPLAGLLGSVAASLGGAGSPGGKAALAAASAVGTAIAGVTFIKNSGIWQMLDKFGAAPGVQVARRSPIQPTKPGQAIAEQSNNAPASSDPVITTPTGVVSGVVSPDPTAARAVPADYDDSVHEPTDGQPDEPVAPDPEVGSL